MGRNASHDQIQDETQYDYVAPPPPVQLTVFHEPLVLHSQIEVACPLAIVLILATNDTHARMDRLEQRFRRKGPSVMPQPPPRQKRGNVAQD